MAILLVKVQDNAVPDTPGKWRAGEIVAAFPDTHVFGGAELPEAGKFYHILVTDKTVEQAQDFIEDWNHKPTMSVVSSQPPNYRIRCESPRASLSGRGEILREKIEELIDELSEIIGDRVAFHSRGREGSLMWFQLDLFGVDSDERDAVRDYVEDWCRNIAVRRRRLRVSPGALADIAAQASKIQVGVKFEGFSL